MKIDLKKLDPRRWIGLDSPVTLTFALLCLLALALGKVTGGWTSSRLFSVGRAPAGDLLLYPRLFLHVLGHMNFTHLVGNMSLLLVLGPIVEERYGAKRLVMMMAAAALVTALAHIILSPGTVVSGASGIVFMLIFLAAASGRASGKIPLTLILVAILYLGREVADGLFSKDNISQLSHIIGGGCGIAFGMMIRKKQSY
jgi:rhomboid protease GluP